MKNLYLIVLLLLLGTIISCEGPQKKSKELWAEDILGDPEYRAMSYGAYRTLSRDTVPGIEEIMEDMKILSAIGIKVVRTYNTQQYAMASNLLEAIKRLKTEDPAFKMYVMLGAWIDCKNAWTALPPDHVLESVENNTKEIEAAVKMANNYPDIVKIIAVGNEAMVHWASSYFVQPATILKWVNHLQGLKKTKELDPNIWITSSDNFASWGGGDESYHKKDLEKLIKAVDYISLHTYPFHDTHYNSDFWNLSKNEEKLSDLEKMIIKKANCAMV